MKTRGARSVIILVSLLALAYAYGASQTAALMERGARGFLDSLTSEQKAIATFPVDAESRTFWHFIPSTDIPKRFSHPRPGLTLEEMTVEQRHLAGALLSAGLSRDGYAKASTIMSLESVLRVLEGDSGVRRNPAKYHFSVFGEPDKGQPWGYRVEGHHLSLHYLVAGGVVTAAPSFFGANPREVREGPRQGLRALPRIEDLARKLIQSMDPGQRKTAIVADEAYRDILTGADRKAALEGQPSGIAAGKLTGAQRRLLAELVGEYADSMPPEIAERRRQQFQSAGDRVFFAWAGSTEKDEAHYYRIQTDSFLIEYDCVQNKANHIHSVWRDWQGDFGLDLLARHRQRAHR